MAESTNPPPPGQPDDPTLLAAVARVWHEVDPPPVDLADGVLARIAAEDLEFELLTLVETQGELAGVRHAEPEGDDAGAWMLEYQGPDERVYVRLTRIEDRTRVDGWVVPTRPMAVQLSAAEADRGDDEPLESEVDEFGRFEFPSAPAGLSRLTFLDVPRGASRPRVTPPFWI